jgi:hypothetical protein
MTPHIKSSQSSLAVAWYRLPTANVPHPQLPAPHFSHLQLSTDSTKVSVRVTLRQAVHRQSVHLGAPWGTRPELLFNGHSSYVTSSLTRRWVCLLWICLAFCQVYFSHITCYWKFLPFALHTSPLSVQAFQSRCLSYLSHATTAA